jgi:hypothetical protein
MPHAFTTRNRKVIRRSVLDGAGGLFAAGGGNIQEVRQRESRKRLEETKAKVTGQRRRPHNYQYPAVDPSRVDCDLG